jgi:hypothetical protein
MRSDPEPTSGASVDGYLQTVKHEQQRFLDAIERARQQLDPTDGQLAHVAAIQGRLARQFLDGQRAILRRRAETDREVATLAADACDRADRLVAEARHDLDDFDVERLQTIEADVDALALGQRSVRHDLAAFGTTVVRTSDDARSLAGVLDLAMRPDDPDGWTAARQLGAVLDDWWHQANDEAQAQVRDAQARTAIRLHVAAVEVRELLPARPFAPPSADERSVDGPTPAALSSLNTTLRSADHAEHAGLETLLSELELALERGDVAAGCELAIRETPAAQVPARPEPYGGFWPSGRRGAVGVRSWLPVHVVMPMVGLTVGLALVMAWVG